MKLMLFKMFRFLHYKNFNYQLNECTKYFDSSKESYIFHILSYLYFNSLFLSSFGVGRLLLNNHVIKSMISEYVSPSYKVERVKLCVA
jgi:hypothetical protein